MFSAAAAPAAAAAAAAAVVGVGPHMSLERDADDEGDPYFSSLGSLAFYHHRLFAPGSSLSYVG